MGFSKKAKVISYKFDPLLKRYKEMELGDFSPTVTSPITRGANAGQVANTAYGKSNNAEVLLQQHLNDFNNPHRVTADQVNNTSKQIKSKSSNMSYGESIPSDNDGMEGDFYVMTDISARGEMYVKESGRWKKILTGGK